MLFEHNTFSFYLIVEEIGYSNSYLYDDDKNEECLEETLLFKCNIRTCIPDTHMFYTNEDGKTSDMFLSNEGVDIRIYKNGVNIPRPNFSKIGHIGELRYIAEFKNTYTNTKDGNIFEGKFIPPQDNFDKYYEMLVINKLKPKQIILKIKQKIDKQNHGELIVNYRDILNVHELTLEFLE